MSNNSGIFSSIIEADWTAHTGTVLSAVRNKFVYLCFPTECMCNVEEIYWKRLRPPNITIPSLTLSSSFLSLYSMYSLRSAFLEEVLRKKPSLSLGIAGALPIAIAHTFNFNMRDRPELFSLVHCRVAIDGSRLEGLPTALSHLLYIVIHLGERDCT